MSAPTRTVKELTTFIRSQVNDGIDPRLTISEVSVLVQFHRRTLQRYLDEKLMPHERIGPKQRIYMRWSTVRKEFPEDTKRI
jgi:excisionase family DNA binding protein